MRRLTPRGMIAIGTLIAIAVVVVGWQTIGALAGGDEVPSYRVQPPSQFSDRQDPTIVSAEKLREPLVPDEDAAAIREQALGDFALVRTLSPSLSDLTDRLESRAAAERLVGQLAPEASSLAGAQVSEEPIEYTVTRYDTTTAVVSVAADYETAAGTKRLVFEMAYRKSGEEWHPSAIVIGSQEPTE